MTSLDISSFGVTVDPPGESPLVLLIVPRLKSWQNTRTKHRHKLLHTQEHRPALTLYPRGAHTYQVPGMTRTRRSIVSCACHWVITVAVHWCGVDILPTLFLMIPQSIALKEGSDTYYTFFPTQLQISVLIYLCNILENKRELSRQGSLPRDRNWYGAYDTPNHMILRTLLWFTVLSEQKIMKVSNE